MPRLVFLLLLDLVPWLCGVGSQLVIHVLARLEDDGQHVSVDRADVLYFGPILRVSGSFGQEFLSGPLLRLNSFRGVLGFSRQTLPQFDSLGEDLVGRRNRRYRRDSQVHGVDAPVAHEIRIRS